MLNIMYNNTMGGYLWVLVMPKISYVTIKKWPTFILNISSQ